MNLTRLFATVALASLFSIVGCGGTVQNVTVSPAAGAEVLTAVGQTAQFHASETTQEGSSAPDTHDATHLVLWTSGNPAVATISPSGVATAVGAGTAVITASSGGMSAASDVTVTLTAGNTVTPTLSIIPVTGTATASRVGETTQFLAVGNLGSGASTQDLTDQVRWVSSDVSVATIDQAGLATVIGAVNLQTVSTITAIGTLSDGSSVTSTSTLTITPITGTVKLPTLAIYKVGAGTGTVTSAPSGINCGPQATCTGFFTLGATVTLTASPDLGSSFGGWSANCVAVTATTCRITMSDNDTVGAIFN